MKKDYKESKKLSKEEKKAIIENAISSFEHGIQHLLAGNNDENIKFSVLHIFNSLELITKAHLGSINEALLWPNVDKRDDRNANISELIKRMNQFSDKNFNEDLVKKIEKLRKKRNEIEHKKLIIEDEKYLMLLLFSVVEGVIIFLRESFQDDNIAKKMVKRWENIFLNRYMSLKSEFDDEFKKNIGKLESIKNNNKNIEIKLCDNCMLKMLPYKREKGKIKCLNCGKEIYILECYNCGETFFAEGDDEIALLYNYGCTRCNKPTEEEEKRYIDDSLKIEAQEKKRLSEIKKSIPFQNFEI